MALDNVPFFGAFTERSEQNEQSGLKGLQQQGVLVNLANQVMDRRREMETREALRASGGDPEKAAQALLNAGNTASAAKLAPLIEARRKATSTRVVPAGAAVLGPNNEVIYERPTQPSHEANPEIVKLAGLLQTLPANHPARSLIERRAQYLARGDSNQGPSFGNGATGAALNFLTKNAEAYGAGTLDPENARFFESALTHYTQPRQYQNPDTGLLETRRPEVPAFVQNAVAKRRGVKTPQPAPAAAPQDRPADAPQPKPGGKTIWDMSELITGPVPAAAELASRTPLVGDMVQAPQFTQARTEVQQLQRDLVRTLQNNPRYAEGERKAIEQDTNIEPRLFDNPTAYRDRLIGMDNALALREMNAFKTSRSANVGREERVQAMNVLNAIRNYREKLGVPPTIAGEAQYKELPSGSVYIDARDGKQKRKK